MARVVFRADASLEIGTGHVMRCLALADTLAAAGWSCGFAVRPETPATVPALGRSGFPVHTLENGADGEPAALAHLWPDGMDWLIVDHYRRDAAFEGACRGWAAKVMVIDDLADRRHDCDLLMDQTLGREAADYADLVPAGSRMILGPAYAPLRRQFREARAGALARRGCETRPPTILVSMGGTDPHGMTRRVLQGIGQGGIDARIEVVVGAAADAQAEIRKLAAALANPVNVHSEVEGMAGLMAHADIGVGAAGTTSWERCCLGLPGLLVITADNQRKIASELEREGAAEVLGWHADVGADRIGEAVAGLCRDVDQRRRMSSCAAEVCDGLGGERIWKALS